MYQLTLKSFFLALMAILVSVGVAVLALPIVLLIIEAQTVEVCVYAGLRALCAYLISITLMAIFLGMPILAFALLRDLAHGWRHRRPGTGSRIRAVR